MLLESAVSAAAYQSGEKLFSEYDQKQKHYPYKIEVTHKETMLPPHAPPEFADRNTLWNSAEAQEKRVVIFMYLSYNKNVNLKHRNTNKSVKECIYGTIDFE